MRKLTIAGVAALALALPAAAGAALVPGVYDPGSTGCPKASYGNGVLRLELTCAGSANASAGANITGVAGELFGSAAFTLARASQCQGGSPRFDVKTSSGFYFLGCNNVAPVANADGTATYTFTAATLAAAGQQVPTPAGTIVAADVLIDVQGTADITDIAVNGKLQKARRSADACKKNGWKAMSNPSFKSQGQCVSYFNHLFKPVKRAAGHAAETGRRP